MSYGSAGAVVRVRRGAVLLEALVALVILALTGVAMITLLGQTVETARQVHRREAETRAAGAALERVLAWDRSAMVARVGQSRLACCGLTVEAVTPALFRVAVSDTATGAVLLETSYYAPPPPHATTP